MRCDRCARAPERGNAATAQASSRCDIPGRAWPEPPVGVRVRGAPPLTPLPARAIYVALSASQGRGSGEVSRARATAHTGAARAPPAFLPLLILLAPRVLRAPHLRAPPCPATRGRSAATCALPAVGASARETPLRVRRSLGRPLAPGCARAASSGSPRDNGARTRGDAFTRESAPPHGRLTSSARREPRERPSLRTAPTQPARRS